MGDAYEWWWVMRYHSEITQKTCRSVPTSLGRTNTIFTWASLCKVSNSLKPIILVTYIYTPQRMVLYCECQEHKSKAMNNHETCPKGSNFLKLWSSCDLYISQNTQTFRQLSECHFRKCLNFKHQMPKSFHRSEQTLWIYWQMVLVGVCWAVQGSSTGI